MRLLFLDIDGVLNDHFLDMDSESCTIDRDKIKLINNAYMQNPFDVVISSAWRYMIHGGAMTILGFNHMLRAFGLRKEIKLHGITCTDEEIEERGYQINAYLLDIIYNSDEKIDSFVVIDDLEIPDPVHLSDRIIKTNPREGMTKREYDLLVRMMETPLSQRELNLIRESI